MGEQTTHFQFSKVFILLYNLLSILTTFSLLYLRFPWGWSMIPWHTEKRSKCYLNVLVSVLSCCFFQIVLTGPINNCNNLFRPYLYGLRYQRQPSPAVTLDELTFPCVIVNLNNCLYELPQVVTHNHNLGILLNKNSLYIIY